MSKKNLRKERELHRQEENKRSILKAAEKIFVQKVRSRSAAKRGRFTRRKILRAGGRAESCRPAGQKHPQVRKHNHNQSEQLDTCLQRNRNAPGRSR